MGGLNRPPFYSHRGLTKPNAHSMIMACSVELLSLRHCMHEGSLTEDLFEHVLIHAREANARRVTRVKVTIGALSDATAESIQFYWDSLAPGTIAEEAVLEFETAPGTAKCTTCGEDIRDRRSLCRLPQVRRLPGPGDRRERRLSLQPGSRNGRRPARTYP